MEEDERGQEGQIRDYFYTKDCEILHVLASFILVSFINQTRNIMFLWIVFLLNFLQNKLVLLVFWMNIPASLVQTELVSLQWCDEVYRNQNRLTLLIDREIMWVTVA